MDEFEGTAAVRLNAPPRAAFELITDPGRLPVWNAAIERVIESPPVLTPDAEWVVLMHPRGLPRWRSRSHVEDIDAEDFRFAYRTQTDDGNPSYARWAWHVTPAGAGSDVTVSWGVHPKTIGRKLFGARLRRWMLAREVPASLEALRSALAPASAR